MLRRSIVVFGTSVLVVGAWAACVGDDPATTTTTSGRGAQGQACFENNTCLGGLSCLAAVCQVDQDGAASGGTSSSSASSSASSASSASSSSSASSASSSSSSSSASSSGSTTSSSSSSSGGTTGGTCRTLNVPVSPLDCPVTATTDMSCAAGNGCCPGDQCRSTSSCAGPSMNRIQCFATRQCPAGSTQHCCWLGTLAIIGAGLCSNAGQSASVANGTIPQCLAVGAAGCGGDSFELCATDAECVGVKKCKPTAIDMPANNGPIRRVVGVCSAP